MNLYSFLSRSVYQSFEFADTWIGLPNKATESLHYRQEWREFLPPGGPPSAPTLWIHGASVGELEDLAGFFLEPERLQEAGYESHQVVLTSSSVSARTRLQSWAKQNSFAYAGPLPPESSAEVDAFLAALKPELLVLSHSDLWPVLLERLTPKVTKGVLWLPSRVPSPQNRLARRCLKPSLRAIAWRHETALQTRPSWLVDSRISEVWIGNPRIDRILQRIELARSKDSHALSPFGAAPQAGRLSILVGSAWPEDVRHLNTALSLLEEPLRRLIDVVVIPHEVRDPHLVATIQNEIPLARVLATEGLLVEAYQGFDWAFVGGGFRTGLHNVLEPALWEVPTLCGPQLRKQPEANELVAEGQLHPVSSAAGLAAWLHRGHDLQEAKRLRDQATHAATRLRRSLGAPQRLAQFIKKASS